MAEYATEVEIAAPPERVWSVMADVENWREWTPTVTAIRLLDAGPLRIGARAMIRQPKLLPAVWRVTELEPGREFTWVSGMPGARVAARHAVAPSGAGARARLSIAYTGLLAPVLGWLTGALSRSYLATEAAGLKKHCEKS